MIMKDDQTETFLSIATHAAVEGGNVLEKYWGKLADSHIQEKTFSWDLVTQADKEAERVIIKYLHEKYPSHLILAEESGLKQSKETDYCWIIDPLDGTTNYTHQYPMVSVSIALTFQDIPVVGVVYNPILNEIFQAGRGLGATFNQKKIHVSKVSSLTYSLLSTGFAYNRRETANNNYAEFCHLTHHSQGVRRGGSAALDLAYVAAGRLDGYWERGLKPWDIAAGCLIVEEAGGKVTSYEGTPLILTSGRLIASNGLIHQEMIEELKKAHEKNYFKKREG